MYIQYDFIVQNCAKVPIEKRNQKHQGHVCANKKRR
jgi:hypothetical protein